MEVGNTMHTFSSISPILCQLGPKDTRDMGCEYHYSLSDICYENEKPKSEFNAQYENFSDIQHYLIKAIVELFSHYVKIHFHGPSPIFGTNNKVEIQYVCSCDIKKN